MGFLVSPTTVIVNKTVVSITKKPKYKLGRQKNSGDKVKNTFSPDYREALNEVTLTIPTLKENLEMLDEWWSENPEKIKIELIDKDRDFIKVFNKMSIPEYPEIDFDRGSFEVVFKGGQTI